MKALSIELKIILFTLAAHLFYSNSELLIAAKEMATPDAPVTIFDKTVLTAFALSYSIMTTVAVFSLHRLFPVLVFAVLDGFAVYLRINVEQPAFVLISSLFYGFYTAYIIVIAYMLKAPALSSPAASTAPTLTSALTTTAPAPATPAPKRTRKQRALTAQPATDTDPSAETTRAAPADTQSAQPVMSIPADTIRPTSFTQQLTLF